LPNGGLQFLEAYRVTCQERKTVFVRSRAAPSIIQNALSFFSCKTIALPFGVRMFRSEDNQARLALIGNIAATEAGMHSVEIASATSLIAEPSDDFVLNVMVVKLACPVLSKPRDRWLG
jgi:hypothetical protein